MTQEMVVQRAAEMLQANVNAVRVVMTDLQKALNLIRDYQTVMGRMEIPDPSIAEANTLLKRYQIEPGKPAQAFRVMLDGVDITDPTDLKELESIFEELSDLFDVDGEATEDAGDLNSGERKQLGA